MLALYILRLCPSFLGVRITSFVIHQSLQFVDQFFVISDTGLLIYFVLLHACSLIFLLFFDNFDVWPVFAP